MVRLLTPSRSPRHRHPNPPPPAPPAPACCSSPFPDQRHLYLLAAGLVIGLLLGPGLLGRFAPGLYEEWFTGGAEARRTLAAWDEGVERDVRGLLGGALDEHDDSLQSEMDAARLRGEPERLMRERRWRSEVAAHREAYGSRLLALVLVIGVMMVIEAIVAPDFQEDAGPQSPGVLGRFVTVRYAVLALWLALVVAAPGTLTAVPWVFAVLVLAVALAAAMVPLGSGARTR